MTMDGVNSDRIVGVATGSSIVFPSARWTRVFRRLMLVLLWGAVIGCAGLKAPYEGTLARPENRFLLATIEGKSSLWQAKDIAIRYVASSTGDTLQISGTVERLKTIKNFPTINLLRVAVHFITDDGIILDSKQLWSAGANADDTLCSMDVFKAISLTTRDIGHRVQLPGCCFNGRRRVGWAGRLGGLAAALSAPGLYGVDLVTIRLCCQKGEY